MNNSIATEICCAFVVGMLPVLFTYAFTNARLKNEVNAAIADEAVTQTESKKIQSLKTVLEEEQEKIRRLQSTVYQMMGKLYDDERDIQSSEIDYLFGDTPIGKNENITPIVKEDSMVRIHVLESCAEENAKAIADLKECVGSDYWSFKDFNELFMRMQDSEKKIETQDDVIHELKTKNSDLEKRMKVLEEMMNVLPPLKQASWDEPVGRWD